MTRSPERTALAEALAAHSKAVEAVERAADTLAKARVLRDSLQAQAASFDELEDEIASARAASVKLALVDPAAHRLADQPTGFAARIVARDHTLAELAAVSDALAELEGELNRAQDEALRLDIAVEHAAAAVFATEAERLAIEFNSNIVGLRRIHYLLGVMSLRRVRRPPDERRLNAPLLYGDGPTRQIDVPKAVRDALSEDIIGTHERRHGFAMRDQAGRAAAVFWDALQVDPDATLDPEPEPSEPREPRLVSLVPRRTA